MSYIGIVYEYTICMSDNRAIRSWERTEMIYRKNHLFFYKRINSDPEFKVAFRDLFATYWYRNQGIKEPVPIGDAPPIIRFTELVPINKAAEYNKVALGRFRLLPEESRFEIYKNILSFLKQFTLGEEWFQTMLTALMGQGLCPPSINFYIGDESGDKKTNKSRVVLSLNPDTSIEDIICNWDTIKKKQSECWPTHKSMKSGPKELEKLRQLLELEFMKYQVDEINCSGLSEYEQILYKQKNKTDIQKEEDINNHRKSTAEQNGSPKSKVKSFKIKTKLTDVDLTKISSKNGKKITIAALRHMRNQNKIK